MYDNGIFVVVFLTLTFCKHRPVRNIQQPVIPLTDCGMQVKYAGNFRESVNSSEIGENT